MASGLSFPEFSEKDVKLKIPCGAMVAGPSQSGKSTFMSKLFRHAGKVFNPAPKFIIYAYGEYDERIHEFQRLGAHVVAGLPTDDLLDSCPKPALVALDDLMLSAKDSYLQELYTKKAHHKNLAVFFVTQNLFDRNARVARMNSQYIFVMRAPNAALHIRTLGTQLFPRRLDYFLDAYRKATEKPYQYLMIDMHPTTSDSLRLRTNIFPEEEQTVFLPK